MSVARSVQIADRLTRTPAFQDPYYFCEAFLKVLNRPETSGHGRVSQTVSLQLNAVQRDFIGRIVRARREGRPGRFLVLKARRMGISTGVQSFMMWDTLTHRDRNAFVIAHDDKSTGMIFAMAKRMIEHMPSVDDSEEREQQPRRSRRPSSWEVTDEASALLERQKYESAINGLDLRPSLRNDNVNELWMTHPYDQKAGLNSRFDVANSTTPDVGRGFEVHLLHGSEVAFWDDPEALLGGMLQTFSDDPDTLIVLESTANGAGGYFHDEFWAAWKRQDKDGNPIDTDWEAVFYPWFAMPGYSRPLPPNMTAEEFLSGCDGVLRGMISEFNLSLPQANWARHVWANKCRRDWNLFRQEYPGKPEEAFAFASSRVFYEPDVERVERAFAKDPIFAGTIEDEHKEESKSGRLPFATHMRPVLRESHVVDPPLWVWREPEPDSRYVVAVDPSAGALAGDYSAVQVLQAETREQVAEFHGHAAPHRLAQIAVLLALHYNDALVSWENNGLGRAVTLALRQTEYWNLYQRESMDRDAGPEDRLGWVTSNATKPEMVSLGIHAFESNTAHIHSRRLLKEIRAYREYAGRRMTKGGVDPGEDIHRSVLYGAARGAHDDLLMAWTQALAVIERGYYGGDSAMVTQYDRDDESDPHLEELAEQHAALMLRIESERKASPFRPTTRF
jgi:hypothetical protein